MIRLLQILWNATCTLVVVAWCAAVYLQGH